MILGGKNAGLALFVNIEEMSISDSYVVKENDLRGMAGRSDGMRYRRNRQGIRYAMTGRQRLMYRLCLLGVLIAVMAFTAVYGYFELRGRIPDEITLFQDRVENIDFGIPFTQVRVSQTDAEAARVSIDHAKKADGHIRFSMAGPLSVTAQNCGSLQGEVRLFGWLPCKKIRIDIRKGTKMEVEIKKPKSWCKSVSAFANTLGEKLIFGIADEGQMYSPGGMPDGSVIQEDPYITQKRMVELLGLSRRTVQRLTETMITDYVISRVGSKRTGHWEIL